MTRCDQMAACAFCGTHFKMLTKNHTYCSKQCKARRNYAENGRHRKEPIKACEHCGVSFSAGLNGQNKFCSRECRYDKFAVHTAKQCSECGKEFTTRRPWKETCGPECTRVRGLRTERERRAQIVVKNCQRCGIEFEAARGRAKATDLVPLCGECKSAIPMADRWKWQQGSRKQAVRLTFSPPSMPCENCIHGKKSQSSDTGWECLASALRCKPGILNALFVQQVV